jgi:hypothetical protein
LPLIVSVALGEPGVPVVCWAWAKGLHGREPRHRHGQRAEPHRPILFSHRRGGCSAGRRQRHARHSRIETREPAGHAQREQRHAGYATEWDGCAGDRRLSKDRRSGGRRASCRRRARRLESAKSSRQTKTSTLNNLHQNHPEHLEIVFQLKLLNARARRSFASRTILTLSCRQF